jgi:hypothetical protein
MLTSPHVVQGGGASSWTSFDVHTKYPTCCGWLAPGPDGALWVTEASGVLRITMGGNKKAYSIAPLSAGPIVAGADGRLWLPQGSSIGALTTKGVLSVYAAPGDDTIDGGTVLGSDRNVWFMETGHVGRITASGSVSEFALPSGTQSKPATQIAVGDDGDIWFTEYDANNVGKIDPVTGIITEYSISAAAPGCNPLGIINSANTRLYAYCDPSHAKEFVEVDTQGQVTNTYGNAIYVVGDQTLAAGPDSLYAIDGTAPYIIAYYGLNGVGWVKPPPASDTVAMTIGPDGNLWTAGRNKGVVQVLLVTPITVSGQTSYAVGQTGTLTVSERNQTSWTATSRNPAIATVVQGPYPDEFEITGASVGLTTVTIADTHHNFVHVKISVH